MSGYDFIHELRNRCYTVLVIITTAYSETVSFVIGPNALIVKPIVEELLKKYNSRHFRIDLKGDPSHSFALALILKS